MGQHERKCARLAVTNGFETALELKVVGKVELTNAGGIAAAAKIFQQKRVVKLPELLLRQTYATTHVHTYPATPDAMARRLALGDIQCITERPHKLGQLQRAGGDCLYGKLCFRTRHDGLWKNTVVPVPSHRIH